MEYAQQIANIANVQNYAAQLKDTRLASLKHPGEFFDYQRVRAILSLSLDKSSAVWLGCETDGDCRCRVRRTWQNT